MNQYRRANTVPPVAKLFRSAVLLSLLLCSAAAGPARQGGTGSTSMFTEKDVSFKTEDGWVIHGTLSVPVAVKPGERVGAAVLVHSPAHDRDIYLGRHQIGQNTFAKETLRAALGKTVTIRIDIRGRGKSSEPREYHTFTAEQRARVALDVLGAIDFLSRHEHVDPGRIGVVAEGASADASVTAACRDPRVRALVLLSGRLGPAAKESLAACGGVPVLGVATKEDRVGLADMAEVYKLSRHPASDLLVYRDIGVGNSMFIMWANKFPNEKSLESVVADWLVPKLRAAAHEVSFKTEDGWTLYGTFRLPQSSGQAKAPGVILVHSYLTDRHVFHEMEQMLSAAGFAVLNFDFRGRGKSQEKGTYFDLPQGERDKAYLDVRAAADFLAAQEGVDGGRLAVVATSIGVKYGLKAASADTRVVSFVMLGGMPDRPDVEKSRFPILFVSSLGLPPIAQAFR
ncbi:MAG: alpha/beta fold hydrolase, partial [Pyrinomonadaceae bacterium]